MQTIYVLFLDNPNDYSIPRQLLCVVKDKDMASEISAVLNSHLKSPYHCGYCKWKI